MNKLQRNMNIYVRKRVCKCMHTHTCIHTHNSIRPQSNSKFAGSNKLRLNSQPGSCVIRVISLLF
ncbi:hypothetical protein HanRHA438_Chr17g0815731 [Helianthus annuus]|nr:hypothetical protein HanRHA438_Chr17g0815731 [Helianthus annuus]